MNICAVRRWSQDHLRATQQSCQSPGGDRSLLQRFYLASQENMCLRLLPVHECTACLLCKTVHCPYWALQRSGDRPVRFRTQRVWRMQMNGTANVNLVEAAAAAGVPRMAFISVHDYALPGAYPDHASCSQDPQHTHARTHYASVETVDISYCCICHRLLFDFGHRTSMRRVHCCLLTWCCIRFCFCWVSSCSRANSRSVSSIVNRRPTSSSSFSFQAYAKQCTAKY